MVHVFMKPDWSRNLKCTFTFERPVF